MSITIRDIAAALELDPSTVSSCLAGNHRKRRIADATARKVHEKAAELGYIPNRLAGRIFRRNQRKNIGIVFKRDTAENRNLPALDYAIKRLAERDDCEFSVLYAASGDLTDALKNGIGLGISDFVVIGYMRGRDFAGIRFDRLPPVRIFAADYYFDDSDAEFPGVRTKMGFHRELFYRELSAVLERLRLGPVVTAQALEPNQPEPPADAGRIFYHVEAVDNAFRFGEEVLAPEIERKFRRGECRTLLLRNDGIAAGVEKSMLRRGIRIPEELGLIGFNNAPFAPYTAVPLSTFGLPMTGNIDAILAHLLDGAELPEAVLRPPELFLRSSTPENDALAREINRMMLNIPMRSSGDSGIPER